MVRSHTVRRLLMASLLPGLGMGMVIVAGLAASDTRAAERADGSGVKDGGTLRIGTSFYDYIDPALAPDPNTAVGIATAFATWAIDDATCATLLRYPVTRPSVQDYSLVPEVATGYPAVSRDGRKYTFTIRKGYKFSTGAPVTAANYARAINRVLNPVMGSPAATYLQEIVGADAMQQGAQFASGISVAGSRLIIRLTKKVPDFPARMTMPYICPVPTDLPINSEGVGAPLPGSGPYYIAEFVRGSRVVLKRNPFYRGPRAHHFDQLIVQGDSGESATISRKVEAGELDVDFAVPLARLAELAAKYNVNKARLFSIPSANMFYLYMNTERPLFKNNVPLRQAVNFALDRTQLLFDFGPYWSGSVSDDYLPPGLPGYVNAHVYPVDKPNFAMARALAHGHLRSRKAVMYTCTSSNTSCLAHAQTVQADLKAIGIDVEIKAFPNAVWQAKISTRDEPFDLAIDRPIVPWVDPYQYVDRQLDGRMIQATGNTNRSEFNSAHYNTLIDRAEALSGRARYEAYGRLAVDIAKNAAPMATMFVRNTRFFLSDRVGCVNVSAHGLDLASLCLR